MNRRDFFIAKIFVMHVVNVYLMYFYENNISGNEFTTLLLTEAFLAMHLLVVQSHFLRAEMLPTAL